MYISCCTWALSGSEDQVLLRLAEAGFRYIDFRPFDFRSDAAQGRMRALKLTPSCMATAFGMLEEAALDSSSPGGAAARAHICDALDYAERMGVERAYMLPGTDAGADALHRYAESARILAGHAEQRGIRLCIEHFPGKALPTIADTLRFIDDTGHPNLHLLLDTGHAQISREDPVEAIRKAGDRLGYVHLDDNDGVGDLHWALCDGVLTVTALTDVLKALHDSPYDGPVSLEIHPTLPDPLDALVRSLDTVCQALDEC